MKCYFAHGGGLPTPQFLETLVYVLIYSLVVVMLALFFQCSPCSSTLINLVATEPDAIDVDNSPKKKRRRNAADEALSSLTHGASTAMPRQESRMNFSTEYLRKIFRRQSSDRVADSDGAEEYSKRVDTFWAIWSSTHSIFHTFINAQLVDCIICFSPDDNNDMGRLIRDSEVKCYEGVPLTRILTYQPKKVTRNLIKQGTPCHGSCFLLPSWSCSTVFLFCLRSTSHDW